MTNLTKGEIDRLGNTIRNEYFNLSDETLLTLQNYRTSHQTPLSIIFAILCKIAKITHHSSIATYRIKRFESIINKLDRYGDMRFSRMWDIAGCRIILKDDEDVYKTIEKIKSNKDIQIVKTNDYLKDPQQDGYKSVHLYIKHTSSNIIIEVQLRTLKNHDWATLVEITDLLFNTRLKEVGDDKELLNFHRLLSNIEHLSISDKYQIFKTLKNYNYFEKLSEVFSKNYLIVRKQWLQLESKSNHKYFLIEVDNNTPTITSFSSSIEAEKKYFEQYKAKALNNIVLTYLQNHNYELLTTAYANYILTFHNFLFECLQIIESLIVDCLENNKFIELQKTFTLYNEFIFEFNKNIINEIDETIESQFMNLTNKERDKLKKKHKLWILDINKQIKKIDNNRRKIDLQIQKRLKQRGFKNFIFKYIIKHSNKKYSKKTKTLIENSIVLRQYLKKEKK